MKYNNIKRNDLDIILTDLKPFEVSKIYTVSNLYRYLNVRKKDLDKIINSLKNTVIEANKIIFERGWHAAPLKFNITKNKNEYRTLSILNPLSMLQIYIFIRLYDKHLLNLLDNKCFSIRYHNKNNSLYYKSNSDGCVQYQYLQDNKMIEADLEGSGAFYSIEPFNRITNLYKSDMWFELNNKFKYFAKIDYKACFDSIYTHTFNWMITDNTVDARKFKNNNVLSVIDRLLQNMNSSITNGIVVGPEFSRMMAEIILQHIDQKVYSELVFIKKAKGRDFEICRYVDDIFIFANDEVLINTIIDSFKKNSNRYQLQINDLKLEKGKLPTVWNVWTIYTRTFVDNFISKFFYETSNQGNEKKYLVKGNNLRNLNITAIIKESFNNLITENYKVRDKIVSFCMTSILNQIMKKNDKKIFDESVLEDIIFRFYDMVFYFYSFSSTFKNTEKLIAIICIIDKEIGNIRNENALRKVSKKYDFIILNNNLEDIIDYLILLSSYGIEISSNIENFVLEELDKRNNPILYAAYLTYSRYNEKYFEFIKNIIENKIDLNISKIMDSNDLFLYEEVWWIMVFVDCPYLAAEITNKLIKKIKLISTLDLTKPTNLCKKVVSDFFISNTFDNKFIKWNLTRDEFFETIIFDTYDRTLFNNGSLEYLDDY